MSVFIAETYDQCGAREVYVWSDMHEELCRVGKGQDFVVPASFAETSRMRWSEHPQSQHYWITLHPETKYVRVIRSSVGKLMTWRCYRQRPPEDDTITCVKGHVLVKCYGSSGSGFLRTFVKPKCCQNCGFEIRKGALKWHCYPCDIDFCCTCSEAQVWMRQNRERGSTVDPARASMAAPVHDAHGPRPSLPASAMEQREVQSPPEEDLASFLGQAVPSSGGYKVGASVEVFSVSENRWLAGKVEDVQKEMVVVQYDRPNGSQAMKVLPFGHEQLRLVNAPARSGNTTTQQQAQSVKARSSVGASFGPADGQSGNLQNVPGVGAMSEAELQTDALQLVDRLARHGDAYGLHKAIERAEQLGVHGSQLSKAYSELKALEEEGEFCLLRQAAAGA